MMSYLFTTILLTLPGFGFASPAQPLNSLGLTNAAALTANTIGPAPIDSRFTIQAVYQTQPLVEDDCLAAAVEILGLWGSDPLTMQEPDSIFSDDRFPRVRIESQSFSSSGATEARFLVWGLYLGLKDMISSRSFESVKFALRWESRVFAQISILPRQVQRQPSLPGEMSENSTNTLQARSSFSPFNLPASEAIGRTSFNFSVPPTPSNPLNQMTVAITPLDRPLPKYSFIMAILEGILAGGSLTPRARLSDSVRAQVGSPFNSKLLLVPLSGASGLPCMTYGTLASALRQVPAGVLQQQQAWVESSIKISLNGIWVAQGVISNL